MIGVELRLPLVTGGGRVRAQDCGRMPRQHNRGLPTIRHLQFAAFFADPRLLPPDFRSEGEQPRQIADYIAGMTDRYAMREYRRLFAVDDA